MKPYGNQTLYNGATNPIIPVNHLAVTAMKHNKDHECITLLRDCIKFVLDKKSKSDQNQTTVQSDTCGSDCSMVYISEMNQVGTEVYSVPLPEIGADQELSGAFVMFNRAFLMDETFGLLFSIEEYEDHLVTMLLFNLGLAYHRQAVQKGNTRLFNQAVHVYEMAFSMTRHIENVEMLNIVILAILNNLGHAYSSLFNSKARLCRDQFPNALMLCDASALAESQQEDYCFFCMQSMFMLNKPVTHASCA